MVSARRPPDRLQSVQPGQLAPREPAARRRSPGAPVDGGGTGYGCGIGIGAGVALALASLSCARTCAPRPWALGDASSPSGSVADAARPAVWPVFPASSEARATLVAERTRRPPGDAPDVTPALVVAEATRLGWASLPSGDPQVAAWIHRRLAGPAADAKAPHRASWLLFGTFHDSRGQVDAFRRLVGPGGAGPFTHLVLEQLRADGRWRGVDAGQTGDSAQLERFLERGDRPTFDALAASHEAHDYTAWKYGYASSVLDVVTTARALGIPALGCELPDPLRPTARDDDESARLRELHCLLALDDASSQRAPRRVAMLWGQAHVRAAGFRRFLPPGDEVLAVYAIGARTSAHAPDSLLREALVLNDPLLVPLGDGEAALLLPDQFLGGRIERVRTHGETKEPSVHVSATTSGTFTLGAASLAIGAGEARLPVAPGTWTYCFEADTGLRLVGSVAVPRRGEVELSFDPEGRETRLIELGPEFR